MDTLSETVISQEEMMIEMDEVEECQDTDWTSCEEMHNFSADDSDDDDIDKGETRNTVR